MKTMTEDERRECIIAMAVRMYSDPLRSFDAFTKLFVRMIGTSVAVGFVLGRLSRRRRRCEP